VKEHKSLADSPNYGKSLTGVQNLQKKHQALHKEVSSYEPSVQAVEKNGQELVDSDHFAADNISQQVLELQRQWRELKLLAGRRTQKLSDALEAQKYYQAANEADAWMNDKAGVAANPDCGRDEDAAVKALKKHKTLEEDVEGYVSVVEGLEQEARRLVRADHFDSTNISARQAQVDEQLAGLQTLTAARRSKLEESIQLHQYIRDVDEVVSWVKEKGSVASSDDYGKDYDHLLVLQKKFEEFRRDVNAGMERYTAANGLARRLVAEGHSDTVLIKEKQDTMRSGWNKLQEMIQLRHTKLAGAHEIHRFNRDAREILGRLKDKEGSIPHDDLGKSIATVQVLQRKHETFERECSALGNKVKELSTECIRLTTSHSGANASVIAANMEEVQLAWESLQAASSGRKKKLRAALELQKLLSSVRDLMSWMHDMEETICSEEPARSVSGAEALISKHNEHRALIDAREESLVQVSKAGRKLTQQSPHYASAEIRERLSDLKQESGTLQELWTQQQDRLSQMLKYQQFLRDTAIIEDMSSSHEVHLATNKLGQSVDECDALLKKHEAFERLIASQEEKVTAMVKEAHYEHGDITARWHAVLERRERVKQSATGRRNKLEDCRKLMIFLQHCMEAESWISEKKQVANDESFRDPTNLENKLKKHSEFEAEMNANEQRIQNIAQTGESLVEGDHYASDDIEARVEELFAKWEELLEATDAKRTGLEQALSLVHYRRKVDMVQAVIRDRTAVAHSPEVGRDLEHCLLLTRKFDEFRTELTVDKSRLDELNSQAARLIGEGHSGEHIIREHQASLNIRWEELNSLAEQRRRLLAGAEQVHRFVRDATETNDRMNEKAKALLTDDSGKDLASVEALIRKHEELERDISAIYAKLEQLDQESQRLIGEQPTSRELIEEKQSEITENWEQLTQRADERKASLEQSRELQRFLANLRDVVCII
jgi:spectrin beta